MTPDLLCQRDQSVVLLVDIQERLAGAMPEASRQRVIREAGILLQAAAALDIPALHSEQYPKGLGPTEPELKPLLEAAGAAFEKTAFSCCGAAGFMNRLQELKRPQVILGGMEAHICVLQTAFELHRHGFQPFVVADAVCSRRDEHAQLAFDRLRQHGVSVTTTESVLFEWLRDAQDAQFKAVSKLIR